MINYYVYAKSATVIDRHSIPGQTLVYELIVSLGHDRHNSTMTHHLTWLQEQNEDADKMGSI